MMKNARISLLLCLLCFIPDSIFGQDELMQYSVGGHFENVYDRFGAAYDLKDIGLKTVTPQATQMRGNTPINFQTCLAGDEFELFFEVGSGFNTNDVQINGVPINAANNAAITFGT
jgi:hypothetical protein